MTLNEQIEILTWIRDGKAVQSDGGGLGWDTLNVSTDHPYHIDDFTKYRLKPEPEPWWKENLTQWRWFKRCTEPADVCLITGWVGAVIYTVFGPFDCEDIDTENCDYYDYMLSKDGITWEKPWEVK